MRATIETLEGELAHDLDGLSDRLSDDRFCVELYRALTNRALSKQDGRHLVLSWTRAAEFVDQLRARESLAPLALAGAGGEGVVSEVVLDELLEHGWQTRPLSVS